jgi:ubiquinone/menaquinone biosynthesis C-methylase UbiE
LINEWSRKRGQTILNLLGPLPLDHPKIIDLGCGTGWFTEKLAQIGQVTGIDLSEQAIAVAKSGFPHITFAAGNLFELSLPKEHFDVVVSQEVIAHVEDQVGYLDRAADVLRSRGYLILTTANKFVMERLDWPPEPPGHIEQWLDMKSLKRLLKPRFRVFCATTILPIGHRGILRSVNSHKLNMALRLVIPESTLESLKGRAGLGYTLIAVAQKRS